MNDFAIVAEGRTDQHVIRHVLLGFFEQADDEPTVVFERPLEDSAGRPGVIPPGGWDQVLKYFERGEFKAALQLNRYLVVHIDTDVLVSRDSRLPIRSHDDQGQALSPDALIDCIVDHFRALIGEDILREHGERFIFAIAVDEIECWLLPLIFESQKQKRAKTTGCLEVIDRELRKGNSRWKIEPLMSGDSKNLNSYIVMSRQYASRKVLMSHAPANPSLKRFVRELEQRHITIPLPEE